MKTLSDQDRHTTKTSGDEIHIIGTAVGAQGTLDLDSRVTLELARHWTELGAAVTLYTTQEGYRLARACNLYKIVYCVWPADRWRRFGPPVYLAAKTLVALRQARLIKTDGLIFSASNSWPDVLAAQRARRLNPTARWVGMVKNIDPKNVIGFAANAIVTSQMERNADLFFASGHDAAARLTDRLGRQSHILRLAVDSLPPAAQTAKRKRYDTCFIAAFESITGWTNLAQAWRHVLIYRPGSKLAVMVSASKAMRPLIKGIFARYGLGEDVAWFFDPSEAVKRQTLLASRLLIAPFNETSSTLIGEAMAVGLPVVGFDSAALKFDYRAGRMTVPAGDWASLGHLIIHVLSRRGLYLRLKKQAKNVASAQDWRGCAGQALDWLRQAARATCAS